MHQEKMEEKSMVRRVFVEKKEAYAVKAKELEDEIRSADSL